MNVHSHISDLLNEEGKNKQRELLSKVTQLKQAELMDCHAFWLGNDPIKKIDLELYKAEKPFVLVGTSVFGSLALACHLGENLNVPPQVIIVDTSKQVAKSWHLIKEYFGSNRETDPTLFVKNFIEFLTVNKISSISIDIYDEASLKQLNDVLLDLMDSYGFNRVKQMVNDTVTLQQSWAHEETFRQIREVYKDTDIYAYPSNIIHSVRDLETQKEVASCVEILQPVLSIQTNLHQGEPTELYLIRNNSVPSIMRTLGQGPFLTEEESAQFNREFSAHQNPRETFFYHSPQDKDIRQAKEQDIKEDKDEDTKKEDSGNNLKR